GGRPLTDLSPPSPARRFQHQAVAGAGFAAVDRSELDDLAGGSHEPLPSGKTRRAAGDSVGSLHPVLGQQGDVDAVQECELADGSVPAPPASGPTRATA